ncbi:MAG: tetratricopeptide repeat protein [Pseudomonadota bacterium]
MILRPLLLGLAVLLAAPVHAQEAGYPDPAFQEAEQRIAAGDYAAAKAALERGLKRVPDNANGWVNYGNLQLLEQDWAGAEASYHKALALDPPNYLALNGLGAALLGEQRYEEAIEQFLRAVEAKPGYVTPLVNLADIAVLRNQAAVAIKYYALALEADPNARKPALALAELHVIGGLYDQVFKYIDPLLARDPADAEALELAGRALLGKELPLRALEPLLAAQAADPTSVSTRRLVGIACLQTEQYGCAEDAYRSAITLQPGSAELHLELGQVYRTAGQETWDRAEWHLKKAEDLDPSLVEPNFELGSLEEDLDREGLAIDYYNRAITLQPDHCPSLSNLARLAKLHGDPAAAEAMLDRCLASEPGFVLAILNRGWIRVDAGMCDQAKQDLVPLSKRDDVWGLQARELLKGCP